jgi:hypothetical protein
MRVLAAILSVLVVIGFAVFVGTQAVRGNLIEEGFYERTLRDKKVYDRIYDDLLADKEFAPQIDALLGGVDIKREDVAATIKQIAKPEYVRAMVETAIGGLIRYIQGGKLEFNLDITPVIEGIHGVVIGYAMEEIGQAPVKQSASLEAFVQEFGAVIVSLANEGSLPDVVPSYPIPPEHRMEVAQILVSAGNLDVDNPEHAEVIEGLVGALANDDVAQAIKLSAAALLYQQITESILQLTNNSVVRQAEGKNGLQFVLSPPASVTDKLAGKLKVVQTAGKAASWARILGVVLMVFCLAGIVWIFRGDRIRQLRWAGAPLMIGGVIGFVAWTVGRSLITDKVEGVVAKTGSLPPSLKRIITDVSGSVVTDLTPSFWIPSVVLIAVGAGALGFSFFMRRA